MNHDQFGFRKNHSTTQQLLKITDTILANKQNNEHTVIVSLDLEKVFDTVYTDGLIRRRYEMKFPTRLIQLVKSYTHNRTYYVQANHQTSPPESRKHQPPDPFFSLFITTTYPLSQTAEFKTPFMQTTPPR